jgi:hypothetical protein
MEITVIAGSHEILRTPPLAGAWKTTRILLEESRKVKPKTKKKSKVQVT